MSRKALFEKATGKVVNIILVEDGAAWQPPEGHDVVSAENVTVEQGADSRHKKKARQALQRAVAVGDRWDGTTFIAYVPTAEEVALAAQIAKDDAVIEAELLEKGRQALTNWDSLFFTSGQKFAVVKGLLAYVLRKEGK